MANKIFNSVKVERPRRNVFDLSHENKLSLDIGNLVPILCEEVLPTDSFRVNTEVFIRLSPMIAPIMHRMNVYTHYYFVPKRLLWSKWGEFISGYNEDTGEPSDVPHPRMQLPFTTTYRHAGSLMDYMGIPIDDSIEQGAIEVSPLPFRAYQMIYNEFYRPAPLSQKVPINIGQWSPMDNPDLLTLRQRSWEHDYFTSSLPWPQRGGDVHIPSGIGGAPIKFIGGDPITDSTVTRSGSGTLISGSNYYMRGDEVTPGHLKLTDSTQSSHARNLFIDNSKSLQVDDADPLAGATVNELRRANAVQRYLERMSLGGTRYSEFIWKIFGRRTSDARLQRPEYLGGGKSPVVISEVLQTSATDDSTTAQGNMAGHGISVGNSHGFTRSFEEHGFIIGIMSIMPRSAYSQGLPRHFFKFDKFDFGNPLFANLGEQQVYNKELLMKGNAAYDEDVFGYQSRYCEYKFGQSSCHGEFRTNLDYWHMTRKFSYVSPPVLNERFVKCYPTETKRVFAVTDPAHHNMYCQLYHNIRAIRPLPIFGTPSL